MPKRVPASPPPPVAPVIAESPPPPVADDPVPEAEEAPPGPTTVLSAVQLEEIEGIAGAADRYLQLQNALGLHRCSSNARAAVRAELLFGVLCFATDDAKLPAAKTLRLLTLVDELLVAATTANADANGELPTLQQVYALLSDGVRAAASEEVEPASRFSTAEVAQLVSFLSTTFLRHLAAYQRVFQRPRASLVTVTPLTVETPLPPPPLCLSLTRPSEEEDPLT